jgi:HTH-type transcriptional regulator / antitoxin HigA
MAITLDKDNYLELLTEFAPQVIDSEVEYDRVLEIAERLTFKVNRTVAEIKFLKLIVALIEDYETEHYPIDDVSPHELLQDLMASNHIQPADLVELMGSQEIVSELVNGESAITRSQAQVLGDFFKVSPGLFL